MSAHGKSKPVHGPSEEVVGVPAELVPMAERLLHQRTRACGVLVTSDLAVVQFFGETGGYLAPPVGPPTLNLLALARPSLRNHLQSLFQEVRHSGHSALRGGVALRIDGRAGKVTMLVAPLDSGRDSRFFLVSFDAELGQTLVAGAEARFRRLFETAKDGIMIASGAAAEIAHVNPAMIEMLGYSRRELAGRPLSELELLRGTSMSVDQLLNLHEGQTHQGTYTLYSRDGTPVEAELVATAYSEAGQKALQINLRDVTERVLAEEALRRSEEQLRQSQKMEAVGRLAGGIAHDFNNLLTAIMGYADLILTYLSPDDPLRRDMEQIQQGGQRAATLTRQLLAFSRRQVLQPRVLDAAAVIESTEKLLRRLIGEDIDLQIRTSRAAGRIKADPSQIQQVLLNLVINARDAMPEGGHLVIETGEVQLEEELHDGPDVLPPGPYVLITVSDTGTGMGPEVLSHLFEPFFTTKPKGVGTGLGLSTAYGIIRQSGGTMRVRSVQGQGSTFSIYLPRVEPPGSEDQEPPVSARRPGGSETLLLVEDEEGVRNITARILEENGYTVLEASHGREALAVCEHRAGEIHLVISDIVMPSMNGWEAAEHIRRRWPNIRLLLISGYADEDQLQERLERERLPFLQKPFTPDTLMRKVREVLDAAASTA